ncbi:MAG TPA: heme-binding protein [Steroidobacteraceae bacterium]|nr:heme-binding protein [Steroidobacteraceae bacterium]
MRNSTGRESPLIHFAASLAVTGFLTSPLSGCSRHSEVPSAGGANGHPAEASAVVVNGRPPNAVAAWTPARGPSLELALEAARAAVSACGSFHVGVAILDAAGTPKLYYIPDGTSGVHAYAGYRKAHTALVFGIPSGQVDELIKKDAAAAERFRVGAGDFMLWAGGIPIVVGTEVVGAIGVSGADPSTKDEACALEGLRAVQGRLR